MVFLDYHKKRALAFLTIALAGLAHINVFGGIIQNALAPLTEYVIIGELKIITVIGIVTVILSYLLWKRRYIG